MISKALYLSHKIVRVNWALHCNSKVYNDTLENRISEYVQTKVLLTLTYQYFLLCESK